MKPFIKRKNYHFTLSIVSDFMHVTFPTVHYSVDLLTLTVTVFSVVIHQEDQPEQVTNYAASTFMCMQCLEAARQLLTCLVHFSLLDLTSSDLLLTPV